MPGEIVLTFCLLLCGVRCVAFLIVMGRMCVYIMYSGASSRFQGVGTIYGFEVVGWGSRAREAYSRWWHYVDACARSMFLLRVFILVGACMRCVVVFFILRGVSFVLDSLPRIGTRWFQSSLCEPRMRPN